MPLALPKNGAPPAAPRFVVPSDASVPLPPPGTLSPVRTRPGQPLPQQLATPLQTKRNGRPRLPEPPPGLLGTLGQPAVDDSSERRGRRVSFQNVHIPSPSMSLCICSKPGSMCTVLVVPSV